MSRLDREGAFRILNQCAISKGTDFHALPAENVMALVEAGKAHGYRKPRNANGSYGRMFYAYVSRAAERSE